VQILTAYLKCKILSFGVQLYQVLKLLYLNRLQLQSEGILDSRKEKTCCTQAGSEGVEWIALLSTGHVVRKCQREMKSKPLCTGLYGPFL